MRQMPLNYALAQIEAGKDKTQVVIDLIKHIRQHHTTAGKLGRGGMFNIIDGTAYEIPGASTKGKTQRYQVHQDVADFMDWVVNEIPGVKVELIPDPTDARRNILIGTIDGVEIQLNSFEITPATQTVKARREDNFETNKDIAKESQDILTSQLEWLSDMIKKEKKKQKKNKDYKPKYTEKHFLMLLMSYKSNMNTILRSSANFKYDYKGDWEGIFDLEHTIPAEYVCQILADMYLSENGTWNPEKIKTFFKNYNTGAIPEPMHKLLEAMGLKSKMPKDWDYTMESIIRYYNELTYNHKNTFPLVNLENGETVGQDHANINNVVDFRESEREKNRIIANSIDHSKDSKKFMFDLDYALIISKADVIVRGPMEK